MGLMSSFSSLFSGKAAASSARSATHAVIDGNAMAGVRGRSRPSDQFSALKRIADFAVREGMSFTIVFEGRPLREVEDGKSYRGVPVVFVEEGAGLPAAIVAQARRAGAGTVVVSDDEAVCTAAERSGAVLMTVATLRKAIDGASGGNRGRGERGERGGERGDRGDRGERGERGSRRNGRSRRGGNSVRTGEDGAEPAAREPDAEAAQQDEATDPSSGGEKGEKDRILELMDPL
jgi:hypothetical protein